MNYNMKIPKWRLHSMRQNECLIVWDNFNKIKHKIKVTQP